MKKNLYITIASLFFIPLFLVFSYAQENIEEVGDASTMVTNTTLSQISPDVLNDMYKIKVYYCDNKIKWEKTNIKLTINMRPWKTKNLCMTVINGSSNDHDMIVWFTEAEIDKNGIHMCKWDLMDKENSFYKLVDLKTTNLSLSWNNWTFTQFARIKLPEDTTWGKILWCFSVRLSGAYFQSPGQMFGLKTTTGFPIIINVTWDAYNFWRRDDIIYTYTDNKQLILKILIAILAVRLVITIVKTGKKKDKQQEKKQEKKQPTKK